ncbi:MAG: RluA family pseudouridine synthase [Acidimicrobiales bacterium]
MNRLSVVVPGALEGVRVDKAVALIGGLSRSSVDRLVAAGAVRVDGGVVRSRSTALRAGQLLDLPLEEATPVRLIEPEEGVEFDVVHEDDDVVVVDKPAGLVVHPGAGHHTGTLVNGLVARYPELMLLAEATGADSERPGIVHRLDRGTSGLLVVARSVEAYRSLVGQMVARRVDRRYRALVTGSVAGESGLVDAPIGRSSSAPTRMTVTRKGKDGRTRYEVERRYTRPVAATLIACTLETGRTHQIRVHLSAIGHPVVGDDTYGRRNRTDPRPPGRPFLHATRLGFDHPRTGEHMSWSSSLPEDLREVLGRFG